MWPYWVLFVVVAWLAGTRLQLVLTPTEHWSDRWWLMYVLLVLMIGLRHQVGADWENYAQHIEVAKSQSLPDALLTGDPAYSLLTWLGGQMPFGGYFVNLVCAAIFAWGLVVFCRSQPMPWLALVVAVPYLVLVVAMGYTRQATAIGLVMLGLTMLDNKKIARFIGFVLFAALFHKSAVILIPLAALTSPRRRLWTVFWVALTTLLAYAVLLQDSVEVIRVGYLEAEYESSGAAIRVAMNAIPAALFLIFRKQFNIAEQVRVFWTWMSLGSIALIFLLLVSTSSTAVDRVALYWIPIQLFVWSRLPSAMGKRSGRRVMWVFGVAAYSAAVQFVWLFYAAHANYWLPYQFYPWVLFWQ
jgi:hypothetical protein